MRESDGDASSTPRGGLGFIRERATSVETRAAQVLFSLHTPGAWAPVRLLPSPVLNNVWPGMKKSSIGRDKDWLIKHVLVAPTAGPGLFAALTGGDRRLF